MKTIRVVAAIIHKDGKIFATQRGYGAYKDYWEFPGGKIEPDETPEAALIREIKEELNTTISVERFLMTVEYDYPEFHLSMDCYWCSILEGHLDLVEHESAMWLSKEHIREINWLPADLLVVNRIESENRPVRILFVCHGNICRSPMAEFVMKDMIHKRGLDDLFEIASAATSREEIGNPVYPPARRKLAEHGISCSGHHARQMTKANYDGYDFIIGMDNANIRNILRITGGDPDHKISLLLDHTERAGQEVADPWYTGNFDETWIDVAQGCEALLEKLKGSES